MKDLEVEIENIGGHLNAYTSREQTCYYAKVCGWGRGDEDVWCLGGRAVGWAERVGGSRTAAAVGWVGWGTGEGVAVMAAAGSVWAPWATSLSPLVAYCL